MLKRVFISPLVDYFKLTVILFDKPEGELSIWDSIYAGARLLSGDATLPNNISGLSSAWRLPYGLIFPFKADSVSKGLSNKV